MPALFWSHIIGLFVRPDSVDALGVFQDIPPEVADWVTPAATATWENRARLARQVFYKARAAADAALADQPTGTGTITARWREVTGADELCLAGDGRLADLVVLPGVRSPSAEVKQ